MKRRDARDVYRRRYTLEEIETRRDMVRGLVTAFLAGVVILILAVIWFTK